MVSSVAKSFIPVLTLLFLKNTKKREEIRKKLATTEKLFKEEASCIFVVFSKDNYIFFKTSTNAESLVKTTKWIVLGHN